MVQGIVVPAIDSVPISVRDFAGLEDYKEAVGGWIEAVDIPDLGITVYVNEEGLIHHLPFNSRATFLWWYHWPASRNAAMLVGEAVIVGMPDHKGDATDVPAETLDKLTSQQGWGVLLRVDTDPAADLANDWSTQVVAPIVRGDPRWFGSRVTYEDYFSACAWAMILQERWTAVRETRIVPLADLADQLGHATPPRQL